MIEEDTDVGGRVGFSVRETGIRGEGVDRWAVTGVFRAEVKGISSSEPGKCGGQIF